MRAALASPDSQVLVLLCTRLALPRRADGPQPLSAGEWNEIASRIARSEWQRPGALLGRAASELASVLGVSLAQAERIARLLERGGQMALEVERLADRGIWILTRADEAYPTRWRQRLRGAAPTVVFGAGDRSLLEQGGLAVVGSRAVDEAGEAFARLVGERCATGGVVVVSGAARGVDRAAMTAALEAGGRAVGILGSSLEAVLGQRETRSRILDGRLTLLAPDSPNAPFTVGRAMSRNKLVYTLSDWALVVACDAGTGGTWAGAMENLKHRWVPLFVRADPEAPVGNRKLLELGGVPLTRDDLRAPEELKALLEQRVSWSTCQSGQTKGPTAGTSLREGPEPQPPLWAPSASPREPARIPTTGADEPVDLFLVAWPLIEERLRKPRSERELALLTGLQPGQLRAWLRRALAEGRVRRTARKYVTLLADDRPPNQQRLF